MKWNTDTYTAILDMQNWFEPWLSLSENIYWEKNDASEITKTALNYLHSVLHTFQLL